MKIFFAIIQKIQFLALSIFIFFLPFSKKITKRAFLFLVLLMCLNAAVKYRKKAFKNLFCAYPVTPYVFVFFASIVLAVVFSLNPYHSQVVFFNRYMLYFLIFFVGYNLASFKKNVVFAVYCMLLSSAIMCIGGIIDYFVFYNERLIFSFHRIIDFAPLLMLYVPLSFIAATLAKSRILRLTATIAAVSLLFCLIWNASRLSFVAVLISLVTIFWIKDKKKAVLATVFILLAMVLLLPAQKTSLYTRFSTDSIGDRPQLWHTAVQIFKKHPVKGAGVGMYQKLLYEYGPEKGYSEGEIHLHAHNTYLEILAEIGLIGLFSLFALFFGFFKTLFRYYRELKDADLEAIVLGIASGIIAMLVLSLGATLVIVDFQSGALFWLLFGIAVGIVSMPLKNPKS